MGLESELARLVEPIAPEAVCGESLEDTPSLAAFDAYRVFGQLTAPSDEEGKRPDWRELRSLSIETLNKSKDFRLLAHLLAAAVRTDTLVDVLQIIPVADAWLTRYWDEVYPRLDEDAIMRKNALSSFGDRVAIVDGLRRLPIVRNPQLGSFSLRDLDIARGTVQPGAEESSPPSESQITAALTAADRGTLTQLSGLALAATRSLASIEETMRTRGGGSAAVPDFAQLSEQLVRIAPVLAPYIGEAGDGAAAGAESTSGDVGAGVAVGSIKSRQDAVRALDAVAGYFRKNEPSSPVPLLVERAKRMVTMDFLEVLADLAPEGLDQARKAAGVVPRE